MMVGILAASAQAGGAKHAAKDYGRAIPVPLSRSHVPGIYQQCSMVRSEGGEAKLVMNPFLKIYNADGSFYTILTMPQRTLPAIITTSGTYRVLSDHQLVESLGESIYNSHHAGDENTIIYTLRGDMRCGARGVVRRMPSRRGQGEAYACPREGSGQGDGGRMAVLLPYR